jgi:hypothetical protein
MAGAGLLDTWRRRAHHLGMLNPFLVLFHSYNPLRWPISTHRCGAGLTVKVVSPLKPREYGWDPHQHQCPVTQTIEGATVSTKPRQAITAHVRGHVLTAFGSDSVLSLSHLAPGAYYRNEIVLSGWSYGCVEAPGHPTWGGAPVFCRQVGPLFFRFDTAARQESGIAAYRAEKARAAAETEQPQIQ